ncbi:TPA: hypothetical protein ACGIK9_003404 [Acinetobacter baumannii]|uniref:hypothetical protein n=1 Tax=Acinetobacter baumannii TaxID=470 RepID=UPI00338DF39F
MARNDGKEEDFVLEVREIIDRIHRAIENNKGVRLSAHEVQLLGLTVFGDDPCVSEGD